MTPLRAAVLLALEQECRALHKTILVWNDETAVRYGAQVAAISSRIEYPGLVRSSTIRSILGGERDAGRVLHHGIGQGVTHRWWPVGLCEKLRVEREQAQKDWHAEVLRIVTALRIENPGLSVSALEVAARITVERSFGPCP